MPNYRRAHVPGGTFFFTVKTERNAPIFRRNDVVRMLGDVIRETKRLWPFEIQLNWGSGREHPVTIPKLNRNVGE